VTDLVFKVVFLFGKIVAGPVFMHYAHKSGVFTNLLSKALK
jgi:hypothetical protein